MILGVRALIDREPDLQLVGHSNNPNELIDELASHKPDVLIVDLSLYSQKSLDFLRSIRDTDPNLKIILFSIHTSPDIVEKATEAGIDGYVLKTEDPARIIDAVRAILRGEQYISKNVQKTPKESPATIDSPINLLSRQQFQILQRIGKGEDSRQIADELKLPLKTVNEQTAALQEKLALPSASELLQFAFHWVHHEGGFS